MVARSRILIVAACPGDLGRVRLDVEFREIRSELLKSNHREQIEAEMTPAVRGADLVRELNRVRPHVLHFSGHGETGGIYLENDREEAVLASTEGLVALLEGFRDTLRVVVLNACFTAGQAGELASRLGIPCVVGMEGEVEDALATRFAAGFYGALGNGRSVNDAFHQACWPLPPGEVAAGLGPRLFCAEGTDAASVVLAGGAGPGRSAEERALLHSVVEQVRGGIPRAVAYKRVHDLLQEIEGVFRPLRLLMQDGDHVRPVEQIGWRSVRSSCSRLAAYLGELETVLAETPFAQDTAALGHDVGEIAGRLRAGLDPPDAEGLSDDLDSIESLLGKQLPVMDKGLMESLDRLGLPRLAEALGQVRMSAGRRGEVPDLLGDGLEPLSLRIGLLRTAHHELQELDDELRAEEIRVRQHPRKTWVQWRQRLGRRLDRLPPRLAEVAEVGEIRREWTRVDVLSSSDQDLGAFQESFLDLREAVLRVFNRVDVDLRKEVGALDDAQESFERALNRIT